MIRLGLPPFVTWREDPTPGELAWKPKRRRVNPMTIVAGVAAFNTVASVVAGGPTWWTRAWAVALVVALLLILVRIRIVRGA